MKFPKLAKIIREEVQGKTLDKYIEKFLPTFNALLDSTSNTMTNNVSLRDNVAGQFVDLKNVKGSKLKALEISWMRKDQPLMISLCRLRLVSSSSTNVANAGTVGLSSTWNVGSNIPETHMEEDGRALSAADYPELFAVIGNSFDTQTDPTTGSVMTAPGVGMFRIPNNKGLYKRGAGNSYRSGGTKLVSISVGMYMDDMTAKNGLTGASTTGSGTTASDAHTHTGSGTSSSAGAHVHPLSGRSSPTGFGVYGAARSSNTGTVSDLSGDMTSAGAHTHTYSFTTSSDAHTHTFSVTMTPLLADGDTESRPRSRGVLHVIQVKPIGASSVPVIDPRWGFDGERITCAIAGVADDAEYNVSLWIQA